jgi:hypothetical protein
VTLRSCREEDVEYAFSFFFFLTTLLCVFVPFNGLNIVHGQRGVSVSEYGSDVVSGQGKAGPNHMGNGRGV